MNTSLHPVQFLPAYMHGKTKLPEPQKVLPATSFYIPAPGNNINWNRDNENDE